MKKLFSIFLIIIILYSVAFASAPSPKLYDFYYFNPEIQFDFLITIPKNFRLNFTQLFGLVKNKLKDLDWTKFHFDEGFVLYINEQLEDVKFKSATVYNEKDEVYIAIVTKYRQVYIQRGYVLKDHIIHINFKDFPVDEVILLIITNH